MKHWVARCLSMLVVGLLLMGAWAHSSTPVVKSGLEVFLSRYTHLVKGKRVGLVTNPTGVDAHLNATIDLFRAHPDIKLTALFAPEHGVRGNVRAGENVPGGKDPATGLPVFTLYGNKDHKPTAEGLAAIDVMVFDIQDVGSRAYTYVWHMAECMSGCAAAKKPFIVLDRPNIYGGMPLDGAVTERAYISFIGLYPVPRVYGMTMGEMARYLNAEEKIRCNLTVVPMHGYRRGMTFEETGLPWVPTSPYIPDVQSALCFATTGALGELGCVNTGIGYTLPFRLVGAQWMNATYSAKQLNALNLPGVRFRPAYYKPIAGMAKDKDIQGVQIHVTNPSTFLPATTEVAILCHIRDCYPKQFSWGSPQGIKMFDKAMGTARTRADIQAGKNYRQVVSAWQSGIRAFDAKRQKYLIYK